MVYAKTIIHLSGGKSGGYLPRRFAARQISTTIHAFTSVNNCEIYSQVMNGLEKAITAIPYRGVVNKLVKAALEVIYQTQGRVSHQISKQ